MKRWAKNIFCLFSLLVFVSSVTLWALSYMGGGYIVRSTHTMDPARKEIATQSVRYIAECGGGDAWIMVLRDEFPHRPAFMAGWHWGRGQPMWPTRETAQPKYLVAHAFLGIYFEHRVDQGRVGWVSELGLTLPLWLFLPAAVPPFLWWRKWRKKGGRGFPVAPSEKDAKTSLATEITENTEAQRH